MRTCQRIAAKILLLLSACSGCQSAAGTKSNSGGTGAKGSQAGGNAASNGGTNGTGGSSELASASITLQSVSAHIDGRRGNRVRLSVTGQQSAGTFASVAVTALDSAGNGIPWFDSDHDSILESSTGFLIPQAQPHETTFAFDVLVPLTPALTKWSQAKVAIYDRSDAVSNELAISVDKQPVRASGEACDPSSKSDRCQESLECNTNSSTCVSHTGPSLSQVAYVTTINGPMLLAAGADNSDDVIEMRLGFQDSQGNSAMVNADNNDQNRKVSSMTETTGYSSNDGAFLFEIDPATTFSQIVNKVSFVAVDAQSKISSTLTGTLTMATSRGSGASCDYRGFNYCSGNSVCFPATAAGTNTCRPVGSLQPTLCSAAPTLELASSSEVITGYNLGASVWEPPDTCVSDIGFHHPESVFRLRLTAAQPSLTLTTNRRETHSDTVLYVASACSPTATQILGCNDDTRPGNVSSTLKLTNVAAGVYYVIVDSLTNNGGPFALTVTTP